MVDEVRMQALLLARKWLPFAGMRKVINEALVIEMHLRGVSHHWGGTPSGYAVVSQINRDAMRASAKPPEREAE